MARAVGNSYSLDPTSAPLLDSAARMEPGPPRRRLVRGSRGSRFRRGCADPPVQHDRQHRSTDAHTDSSAERLYWYHDRVLVGAVAVACDRFGLAASTVYRGVTVGISLATESAITC